MFIAFSFSFPCFKRALIYSPARELRTSVLDARNLTTLTSIRLQGLYGIIGLLHSTIVARRMLLAIGLVWGAKSFTAFHFEKSSRRSLALVFLDLTALEVGMS